MKNRPIYAAIWVLIALLSLSVSCKKHKGSPRQIPISIVGEATLYVPAKQDLVRVQLKSGGKWDVTIPPATRWLYATPAKGNGDGQVAFDFSANTGSEREVTVKISTSTSYALLRIVQRAYTPIPGEKTPEVTTAAVTEITAETALVGGLYVYTASSPAITEFGVVWRESGQTDYPAANKLLSTTPAAPQFAATLQGLSPQTGYVAKAYVKTSDGTTHYGAEQSFTTAARPVVPAVPVVVTVAADQITSSSAVLGASYTYEASTNPVTEFGIQWKKTVSLGYPTENKLTSPTPATPAFSAVLSGLDAAEGYVFRGYAKTADGQFHYGSEQSFTTASKTATPPVVTTSAVSAVTMSSARVGGSYIYGAQSPAVVEFGVMWKLLTAADYPEANRITSAIPTVSSFSATLDGLAAGTPYALRAYVKTADGVFHYGAAESFTTVAKPAVVPVVTTTPVTSVTASSAVIGGSYTYEASSPAITEFGVMWKFPSDTDYPEANRITSALPSSVTFSTTLGGLSPTTSYTVRAYAKTADGALHYGAGETFTTAAPAVTPQVNTAIPTSVTATGAVLGGSYSYGASSPTVTELGVEWKKASSQNYLAGDYITAPQGGGASFTASVSGFVSSTQYNCRAYVKCSDGERYYGAQQTFTTLQGYTPPASLALFSDDFGSIVSAGTAYPSTQWTFYSTDAAVACGWKTAISGASRYLECSPASSSAGSVIAYAMLPPVSVSAAQVKKLFWKLAYDGSTNDATRVEVVVSTNYAGNIAAATWNVVRNISFNFGVDAKNSWVQGEADLSAYAAYNTLFVAFRYTGKAVTYRLDDVLYGQQPVVPAIVWGTPAININSGFRQNEPSSATIRIPYSGNASQRNLTNITVTPSGTASVGFSTVTVPNLTLPTPSGQVEITVTGTPTKTGEVRFAVTGLPDLSAPNNGVTANVTSAVVTPGSPFSMVWNMGTITTDNWSAHAPVCKINPTLEGPVFVQENLRQNGTSWITSVQPTDQTWGGNGFSGNTAANKATAEKCATIKLKCQTASFSITSIRLEVQRSPIGPKYTALYAQVGEGASVELSTLYNEQSGATVNSLTATVSGVAGVQDIPAGSVLTIRIVPYDAANTNGTWYLTGTRALVIEGTYR